MYEGLKIANMYTLSETIAAELLLSVTYPWEALAKIGDFIVELGNSLPEDEYEIAWGEDMGCTELQMYFHQLILQDLQLSVKMQR